MLGAHLLNDDAADALLKDLEEPPLYATIVLVADELGPIPETIRSRCQLVPFRRLSERAVRDWLAERRRSSARRRRRRSRASPAGRLDRARRLIDPDVRERRAAIIAAARGAYLDPAFEPADASRALLDAIALRGATAKESGGALVAGLDLTGREAEQRVKRVQRGAEREELLAQLEELAAWYRDLVVVASGAESTVDPRRPARRPPRRRRARPRPRRRSARRRSCARRGARQRSSTSTRASGSTRSSSGCAARSPELDHRRT